MAAPIVAVLARIAVRRAVLKKVKGLLFDTQKIKGNLKIPLPVPVATFEMEHLEKYLLLAERNTRKSFAELLREEMGFLVGVLMARTPPFTGPADRKMSGHAKIGKAAVGRDIGRVYRMDTEVFAELEAVDENAAKAWYRAVKRGEEKKARALFAALGGAKEMLGSPQQTGPLERRLHNRLRNRRGRISVTLARQIVSKKDLKAYIKERQAKVMFGKAGWLPAGRHFRTKGVPVSVRRHAAPGRYKDNSADRKNPYVYAENKVSYVVKLDRKLRIVEGAVRARDRAMANKMERELRKRWK